MTPVKTISVRVEAVIFNSDGELLLALHRKKDRSYWVLPGGHLEFGETLSDALVRELREELGIHHCEVLELAFADEYLDHDQSRHVVRLGFTVDVPGSELQTVSVTAEKESIKDARFFSAYQIGECLDTFFPSKDHLLRLLDSFHA